MSREDEVRCQLEQQAADQQICPIKGSIDAAFATGLSDLSASRRPGQKIYRPLRMGKAPHEHRGVKGKGMKALPIPKKPTSKVPNNLHG